MLAYLTTSGTAPWIVGGIIVCVTAAVLTLKRVKGSQFMPLIAVVGFLVAAIAVLLLGVSKACERAGGCMH